VSALRIKICGFTVAEDLRAALDLGVDLIGLNLARGPRRLELEQAVALARLVPPGVGVVALFVDADPTTVLAQARALRAAAVQLSGDEPPEQAEALRRELPVIKAWRVRNASDLAAAAAYPADALLLDSHVPGLAGGSGQAWDHKLLQGDDLGRPLMIAGGLRPDTVGAAVAALRPWAVDVASGVESAPGRKDSALMRAFIQAARQA